IGPVDRIRPGLTMSPASPHDARNDSPRHANGWKRQMAAHDRWLITGAGGQLGSVILRALAQTKAVVLGVSSPAGPAPKEAPSVRCDLTAFDALVRVVRAHRPTHIVHTAAITHTQHAFDNPDRARLINSETTSRLVELSQKC